MPREIVVTAGCRDLRADVGPVAWMVLEELAMCSEELDDSVVVSTTVRVLAASVGLSKDTVASGLRRLIARGIVRREDQRDRASGCFGNSIYVVDLAGTGVRTSSPDGPEPDPGFSDTVSRSPQSLAQPGVGESGLRRRPGRRTKSVPAPVADAVDGQLSLLDLAGPATAATGI